MSSILAVDGFGFGFGFRAGGFESPKTKISTKEKTKTSGGEKKAFVVAWMGAHRTRMPNFRVYLPKKA